LDETMETCGETSQLEKKGKEGKEVGKEHFFSPWGGLINCER